MNLNNITNTGTWGEQATRLNDNFNKVTLGINTLQEMYQSLSQSAPEVVDTLPQTGEANKIYRLIGTTSYSDYMYNADDLTTPILMATYNNAVEPHPKKSSQNLVTSGGVFDNMGALDVSELNATENPHTLAQYVDLSAALAAVPIDYQKGGMSVKFIQSSDNKYVQYRYMSSSTAVADFTNVNNWQGGDDVPTLESDNLVKSGGVAAVAAYYITDDEWVMTITDSHKRVLLGIKQDGSFEWYKGVPEPIKEYIHDIFDLNALTSLEIKDDEEYAEVHKSEDATIAYGVLKDGTFTWNKGIPKHLKKYISEMSKIKETFLQVPTNDNLCPFRCNSLESNWKGINTMLFLPVTQRQYYNNLSKYIGVIDNYGASIVRTITWQYDVYNPSVIAQYDTVLYYLAKSNKEILLTTHMVDSDAMAFVTDWDPIFSNIEYLANRYNGVNLIYPSDDPNAEGLPVLVKYWEFCNEMNFKVDLQTQLYLQNRFYSLIKSISPLYKVMSFGYSTVSDTLLFENPNYHNNYDIYNFHCYQYSIKACIGMFEEMLSANNVPLEKDFWLTEFAPNIYDNTSFSEEFIANITAEQALIALSYGASRVLYWANEYLISKTDPIAYNDVYYSLVFLYSIHGEGSSKPVLECNNGVYSVRWRFNGIAYTALFADEEINVAVTFSQSATVYNYLGVQKPHNISKVDKNIIYISNSENVILKF